MVLPIIIGTVGATLAYFSVKATFRAVKVYRTLTPAMFASLNNIRLHNSTGSHTHKAIHDEMFKQFPGGFDRHMTETEAFLILGITESEILTLNEKFLSQRHRKCMMLNHPDRGGSPLLAQKINEAKDVLDKSYLLKRR
ncbi:hypothetical protein BABINDRAFT_10290 [Babjeviella inositovora NRRL Y-12698]|uniref:J domain-containing protein n=1 Tax=Babjeviella inositovora NRRL Y-12698 TaxID=984486 RepID=A0A1E3QIG6_9ASCO|nr:uncharacterized protein BABINDRAFT_10290 [Babjeviella inositovora NRRL Y-12698]ODQ77398.1 hypothetical protein BABINDRAFT_10290 [Babjeviella inositovora NRRL Y-12698]